MLHTQFQGLEHCLRCITQQRRATAAPACFRGLAERMCNDESLLAAPEGTAKLAWGRKGPTRAHGVPAWQLRLLLARHLPDLTGRKVDALLARSAQRLTAEARRSDDLGCSIRGVR